MPVSPSSVRRFWAIVLSVLLGYSFVVQPVQLSWTEYWLRKDGQQGTGIVTDMGWTGHGGIAYRYRVNQEEYTGTDSVTRYNHGHGDMSPPAVAGQHLAVYFSASHPWLSRLSRPDRPNVWVPHGLPLLVGIWVLVGLLILTAIKPNGRWALGLTEHRFFLHQGPR